MGPLEPQLYGFFLVLLRTGALFQSAPLLGGNAVPPMVRLGLTLPVAFAVFSGAGFPGLEITSWATYIGAALVEMMLGLSAGLCARLVVSAAQGAGHLAGMSMGLGFAQMLDPNEGQDSTSTAEFVGTLALVSFVAMGGLGEMIAWLSRSVAAAPPGTPLDLTRIVWSVVGSAVTSIGLAVKLAYPVLAAVLIGQVGLAVLGRTAPQLNMASVGFTVTILAGASVMYVVVPNAMQIVARETLRTFSRGF